ncbi:MAG: class I SAM-dependent methyltransferase [Thermoleophilaceae bacterium]|nr:class I SAM-dependent methyltransferase [Thermoleophilaceae bacterium]
MRYLDFLERVHELLEPRTYLEIGVRHGDSLALARAPSIGVDPAYRLRVELRDDVTLFRETSDEFFARPDPLAPLGGLPVDLSFIDGMHLSEYALRDFVNVEKHSRWTTAVVFDDIFPTDATMAARNRETRRWTGDVFKILGFLREHRPDLVCLPLDTEPTGLLLVLGLDPTNDALNERYDDLFDQATAEDPQEVPDEVLRRKGALDPEAVLAGSFWGVLRDARAREVPRRRGMRALRRALRRDGLSGRSLRELLPLPA